VTEVLEAFFESVIRTATPLAFAALGETIVERSGVINMGLEGSIICGSLSAVIVATSHGPWTALIAAGVAGTLISLLLALFVTWLRSDQIISGTAITLFSLGLTGTFYRVIFGSSGSALTIQTMAVVPVPILSSLPGFGRALFAQPPITYTLYALIPALSWWLYRTHAGLAVRAVGENPEAAGAAGIAVGRIQLMAILFGGFMGGVAGGVLVVAQAGTFAEGMSAGRGFIAIAIVVLGRWDPARAALASVLFGAASALQYLLQSMGWSLPYQLFLVLPYFLTLFGLAGFAGRARPPSNLGKPISVS
jgi:simple sugar transport system permease protein